MFVLFNIILIGLALLIAYWWANQGFFSAVLHCVCVIVAGAIALGVWEPLAILLLERGILENYAWGIALLAPFALSLLLCRIAADKLVPDNVNFPQWVNYVFGGLFGAVAGVLTVGMLLIGAGFVQSTKDLMGYEGAARSMSAQGQPYFENQSLWVPMAHLTEQFYATLSAGALAPEVGRPLRVAYPRLADTALSLHRDSFSGGRARTAAPPDSITLGRLFFSPDYDNGQGRPQGAWILEVELGQAAGDRGGVVTVSASQIRLIETLPAGENRAPNAVHPLWFSQPLEAGGRDRYPFDDISNYASNVPGQQATKFFFSFPAAQLGDATRPPQYVQIKGLRFRLPNPEPQLDGRAMAMTERGMDPTSAAQTPLFDPKARTIARRDIVSDFTIAPANASINELTNIDHSEQFLTAGTQEFQRGGRGASPINRIKGIYAPEGTSVIRLNISRRISSIDVWNELNENRKNAGEEAPLLLVDALGNTYAPIGYIWVKPEGVEVRVDPKRGIPAIKDFPFQPSSGSHELFAIFTPTVNAKIVSIRLGNIVLANADFDVPEQKR
jgi:uncharacterized membrane protein required for colicin V production